MKKILVLLLIAVFMISGCTSSIEKEDAFASFVVDGDTFVTGTGDKVRLIGIDAPERNQSGYSEAKKWLSEVIEEKEVGLEKGSERTDVYGRLLRYVYLNGTLVNLEMVRKGYARVNIIPPNTKYKSRLLTAEQNARTQGRGIWAGRSACSSCLEVKEFNGDAEGNDCHNPNGEYVVFENSCDYRCNLTHWRVSDKASNTFIFPKFVLNSHSQVTLYSGQGVNSQAKLYMNSKDEACNAVWNNDGDTLFLRNSEGKLVLVEEYLP